MRAGLKGLVSFYNLTKKNINYLTQQFYFSFYLQSTFNAPKTYYCTLPVPTTQLHILSILSPVAGVCFWLIVVCKMIDQQQPPKASMYFILSIFCPPIRHPKQLDSVPPCAPCLTRLCTNIPHTASADYQLFIETSCLIGGHLRPRPRLPLYF